MNKNIGSISFWFVGCLILLLFAISNIGLEPICLNQQQTKHFHLFSVIKNFKDTFELTYDAFFIPTEHEYTITTETPNFGLSDNDSKSNSININLFSSEQIKKLSNIIDFRYVPPTEWFNLTYQNSSQSNKTIFDFTQNVVICQKTLETNIITGENQFVLDNDTNTQESFISHIDPITKTISTIKIETEENAFNHNRQILSND